MKKIREEVLVEIYLEHNGEKYRREIEYVTGEEGETIDWHVFGNEEWSYLVDVDLFKELEVIYLDMIVGE